jgi:hypothetical protein
MRGACQTGREIARELRDAKCAFDRLEVEYRDRNKDTAYYRERRTLETLLHDWVKAFNEHRKICFWCGHTEK